MPTYTFACKNCDGVTTELVQSIHESLHQPVCPKCAWPMVKVFDSPAVSFKGGGFYSTDKGR